MPAFVDDIISCMSDIDENFWKQKSSDPNNYMAGWTGN